MRTDPEAGVPELVTFLLAGTDNPFLQVKRLHDWVATNIRYDLEGLEDSDREAVRDATGALATGRAVCSGFAEVQELLLEAAGFEARTLVGYARGWRFSVFLDEPTDRTTHAWTAVKIESAWYLMDTTWNAGNVTNDTWRHRYTSDYLFTNPTAFAETHLPVEAAWQLIESPLDAETFEAQVYTRSGFQAPIRNRTIVRQFDEHHGPIIGAAEAVLRRSSSGEDGGERRCPPRTGGEEAVFPPKKMAPSFAPSLSAQMVGAGFHSQGLAFVEPVVRTQQVGATTSVRVSVPAGLKLTSRLEPPRRPPGSGCHAPAVGRR